MIKLKNFLTPNPKVGEGNPSQTPPTRHCCAWGPSLVPSPKPPLTFISG